MSFDRDMFSDSCGELYSNATGEVNSLVIGCECYRPTMVFDRKKLLESLIKNRFDGNQAGFLSPKFPWLVAV